MRGRSPDQVATYEGRLEGLAARLRSGPMTVREIRDALAIGQGRRARRPTAASVYAWIAALEARGYVVRRRKRRGKIPGKPGQRERTYFVEWSPGLGEGERASV